MRVDVDYDVGGRHGGEVAGRRGGRVIEGVDWHDELKWEGVLSERQGATRKGTLT